MQIKSLLAGFLCLASVSMPLFAQDEKGKKGGFDGKAREEMMKRRAGAQGGPGTPGGMIPLIPLMAALDSDKDGTLSVSEIANASKSLMTLDKNGDGVLSSEEMRPAFNPMAGGGSTRPGEGGAPNGEMMARMFETRDANKDGKLSGDEIPEQMRERVGMIDQDGDGKIDKSEFQKMAARMGGKAGDRSEKGGKDGSGVRPKRPGQEN